MTTAWGEPTFYAFLDFSPIHTALYEGIPRNEFGETIYLLEFALGDLEAPEQEPIGVYHYAGIRRYLWRESYWNEYNIDHRYFMDRTKELLQTEETPEKAKEYRKLLGMLQSYASGAWSRGGNRLSPPTFFGREKMQEIQKYWRVVYRITQKPD